MIKNKMKPITLIILISINASSAIKTESELGQTLTGGNTSTLSLTGKTKTELIILKNKYKIGASFYTQKTDKIITAERWDFKIGYERKLDKHKSLSISSEAQADKFSGYNPRYNSDIGAIYYFNNTKKLVFSLALFYRYTHENTVLGKVNTFNKMVLTFFHKKQYEIFFYDFKTEYVPNLDRPDDYILNFDSSFGVAISSKFSVKINYRLVYQNVPLIQGNERLDYIQTLTLVGKI